MPWDGSPCDHLADGLHYRGEEQTSSLLRRRTGLDCRQRRPCVDMREILRFERRRHGVLWIVRLSWADDLSDRAASKWVPMVGRKSKNWDALRLFYRTNVLQLLCLATLVGERDRSTNGSSQ